MKNRNNTRLSWLVGLWSLCAFSIGAQTLRNPFDFPLLLSGNFGELRSNHFHSGIDFKTQGAEGKPVHAVQAGYVARISVGPWGYGNALYLAHPDGTTTVYGHLQRYNAQIASYLKAKQYELERFQVDLTLDPGQIPVEAGEVVAWSGNTGSSGGPHLHFEVRDTQTEEVLDPLEYYIDQATDTRPPKLQGLLVVPMEGKGVVNGSARKLRPHLATTKEGKPVLQGKIEAWGEIGLAVKANDYMDNTSNIFGVRVIRLSVDSVELFQSDLNRFAFSETRYLNAWVDYEEWQTNRAFYMRSYIEPGNRLRFMEAEDRGVITIDEERPYQVTYTLADLAGNTTHFSFRIIGKRQAIPQPDLTGREHFRWNSDNRFGAKGIRLVIPKGNLYADIDFLYRAKTDSNAHVLLHRLHDKPVAMHQKAQLSLFVQQDTLATKRQYGIVRIHKGKTSWIGGNYRKGWLDAEIRELGDYAIQTDTRPPSIIPILPKKGANAKQLQFRLTDNLSGVERYRGEIDGQYALFEMNARSVITYRYDPDRLSRGPHKLRLVVVDACGNEAVHEQTFTW